MNRFVLFLAFCVAFSSAFVHARNVRSLLKRADCVDKLSNCKAFGDNACSNQRYAEWATENCALTCNKCQSSGGSVPVPVQGVQAGMGESLGCVDKLSNCKAFGANACSDQQYAQWATENCALTCNKCQSSGGSVPVPVQGVQAGMGESLGCVDKLSNCKAFGANACSDQHYAQWATENCALTCNKCQSSGGSVPVPVQGVQAGMGESLEGCVYKGVVHQQGETWKDGCTYKCTCTDGTIGKYTCTGICLPWNLPDACTMNPPAPGKCCKTPYCPPTVLVLFPANYVAE